MHTSKNPSSECNIYEVNEMREVVSFFQTSRNMFPIHHVPPFPIAPFTFPIPLAQILLHPDSVLVPLSPFPLPLPPFFVLPTSSAFLLPPTSLFPPLWLSFLLLHSSFIAHPWRCVRPYVTRLGPDALALTTFKNRPQCIVRSLLTIKERALVALIHSKSDMQHVDLLI